MNGPCHSEAEVILHSGKYRVPDAIDADRTVRVGLINLGEEPLVMGHGQHIAQMVIAPIMHGEWKVGGRSLLRVGGALLGSTTVADRMIGDCSPESV